MSAISTILTRLRAAIWAIDVRDDIANAIEQCYSDVSNPTLKTEALEAALQTKIDEGEMAALTIGDHTITTAKLAQGVIDNTLATSGAAADAKKTGDELTAIKADLDAVGVFGKTSGYYINLTTDPVDLNNPSSSATGLAYSIIDCSAGDKFVINATGATSARAWGFLDSANHVLSMADANVTVTDLELTAPTNAVKLIINDKSSGLSYKIGDNLAGLVASNARNEFKKFTNDHRAMFVSLRVSFESVSKLKVNKAIKTKDDGTGYTILPEGYIVDWSNLDVPAYAKLLVLNKENERLEVIPFDAAGFDEGLLSSHYYVGYVFNGILGDVALNNGNAIKTGGVDVSIYGLRGDSYRDIFKNGMNLYKIPKKVGVIGDSLSVGYMRNPSGTAISRMLPYSWVKGIMQDAGNPWLNLGTSGQNVLTWCTNATYGKVQLEASGNKCQMYIICLGVNDSSTSERGIPLGTSSDIVNNPDSVATTYYGGYARIIQLIKRLNPNALIICMTNPRTDERGESYNAAIRYIVNNYYSNDDNVILMELYSEHSSLFVDAESIVYKDMHRTIAGGHLTALGYRSIATFLEAKLDEIMIAKPEVFEKLPFVDYDTSDPTDNTMIV